MLGMAFQPFGFGTLFPHCPYQRLRNSLCSNSFGARFVFEYNKKVVGLLEEWPNFLQIGGDSKGIYPMGRSAEFYVGGKERSERWKRSSAPS